MTGHRGLDPRYRWCAMSNKVTPLKVIPFRRPSQLQADTPIDGRIVFEVGADRFAIDYAITELNQKSAQVIPIQRKATAKATPPRRRTQTITSS
jgi:hypothetical protein